MKKYCALFILLLLCASSVYSQNKKDVLMTIDGNPVYSNEFKRVYLKNLDLVQDESQKDVDGYLQLFIDYKLKIAEAREQKLDEKNSYKKELSEYREELSRNYLFEDKVAEKLAEEAYERSLEDINASHILVLVGLDASPQDTLVAYNKIKMIRDKALAGEDFTELAKKYTEEPNGKEAAGKLGYFSVFSMVYPFETAAYSTKEGGISEIARTRFGYHVIKVNERRKKEPKIIVSHIMISDKGDKDKTFKPEERINEIYALLKQGESFESLAKQFSDDKNSAVKGGKLNAFSRGDLRSTDFENGAYSLTSPGEFSKPIKSDFGWHIIRLEEKLPMETFAEQKASLEKRVSEGDRSKVITNAVNSKIKEKYGFKQGEPYLPFFMTFVKDDVLSRSWIRDTLPDNQNKTIFTIGNKNFTYNQFGRFIGLNQRTKKQYKDKETLIKEFYEEFESEELKEFFKDELEKENQDYAAVINEYRDGLLIFDVMNKNIWNKAKSDTLGLQKYFDSAKENYKKKKSVTAEIFSATSKENAELVKKMLEEGKTAEEIKTSINKNNKINVLLNKGNFEVGDRELPENLEIKTGVSTIYPSNDTFVVVNITNVLPEGVQSLDAVKGRVLSDYQNYLEETWMKELRNKYKVEVNKKNLKRLKKDLK